MGAGAFAQSGSLTLTNTNKECGVWVNLQAVVHSWDPNACDIVYKTIILPPGPYTITFANPTAFLTFPGPGIGYITNPIPAMYWISPYSDFMWTDVAFQFNCGCGSYMSDNFLGLSCQFAYRNWNDCGRWATWMSSLPPGTYMNDVVLTFG